ncbi:MAG: ribulose-phosphate 3-epimerase [Minisyncoccota bacterium]
MSEIIPAILPQDWNDLEEKLGMVAGQINMVHIDVMDGSLTKDSSWPYRGEQTEFLKIVDEVEGFPFWEETSFEAHLMVRNPEDMVEDWIRAGAERIIVQFEAFKDGEELSEALNNFKKKFGGATTFVGVEIGISINMDTPLEKIYPHVSEADFIHFMSIDSIGRQGNEFDPKIFDRIKEFKLKFPETIISIDGGVNLDNVEELVEVGVNRLIVGSAIFGTENPEESLEEFLEVV